jgi:hypothetical protein
VIKSTGRGPLIDHLDEIEERCLKGDLSLQEIFDIFGSDGHYVLITFLILPFLQPIPLLGLSTPFGILIISVSVLAYLKKPPWIPKKWAQKQVSAKTASKIAEGSEKVFEKLTKILHPRLKFLFHGPLRTINMISLVLNAFLLALPLPIPFSNTIPSWAIALLALAHLEEDGLFVILSHLASIGCLVYFFSIAKGVEKGLGFFGI